MNEKPTLDQPPVENIEDSKETILTDERKKFLSKLLPDGKDYSLKDRKQHLGWWKKHFKKENKEKTASTPPQLDILSAVRSVLPKFPSKESFSQEEIIDIYLHIDAIIQPNQKIELLLMYREISDKPITSTKELEAFIALDGFTEGNKILSGEEPTRMRVPIVKAIVNAFIHEKDETLMAIQSQSDLEQLVLKNMDTCRLLTNLFSELQDNSAEKSKPE
jgi:hypothetical protein